MSETSLIHEARVRLPRFTPRVLVLSALSLAAVFAVAAVVTPQPGRFAPAFAELDALAEDAAVRGHHVQAYRWWVDQHVAITDEGEVELVDATVVPSWVLLSGYEAALLDDEQTRIIYFRLLENMVEQSEHRNTRLIIDTLRRQPRAAATLLYRPLLRKALWRLNGGPLPVVTATSAGPVALTLGQSRNATEQTPISGAEVEALVRRFVATFRDQVAIVDTHLVDGLLARARGDLQHSQKELAEVDRIVDPVERDAERERLTRRIGQLTPRIDGLAARVADRVGDLPGQVPMTTLLRGYGTLDDVIWLHLEALAALGIGGFEIELAPAPLGPTVGDPVRDRAYGPVRWVVALIPQVDGVDPGGAAVKVVAFDPYQGVPIIDASGGLLDLTRWRLGGDDARSTVHPALVKSLPYSVSPSRLPTAMAGTAMGWGAVRVYGVSRADAKAAFEAAQQAHTTRAETMQTLRDLGLIDTLLAPFRARDAAGVATVLRRDVDRIAPMLTTGDDAATASRLRNRLATVATSADLQAAATEFPQVARLFGMLEAAAPTEAESLRQLNETGYHHMLAELAFMLDQRLFGGLWHFSLPALNRTDSLSERVADLCWPAWLTGTDETATARLRSELAWPLNWSMLERAPSVDRVLMASSRAGHRRLTRARPVDQDLFITRSQAFLYARPDVGIERYPNFNWLSYGSRDFEAIFIAHDVWTPSALPGQLGLVHTSMNLRHANRYRENTQRAVNALYGSGSHYLLAGTAQAAAEDLSRFLERTKSGAIDRRSVAQRSGRVDRALVIASATGELRAADDGAAMRATEEYLRKRAELDRRTAAAATRAPTTDAFDAWLDMPLAAETAELWDVSRAPGCFVRHAAFLAGRAYLLDGRGSEAAQFIERIRNSPGPLQAAAQLRPLDEPFMIDVLAPPLTPLEPLVRYGR